MTNHLETLLTEWLAYQGYFVRCNVKVGKLPKGGWAGELDVVAFNPESEHLIHYECSADAWTIEVRQEKFARKFAMGRKYVSALFPGLALPSLEQKVLHAYASKVQTQMGGAEVVRVQDLVTDILAQLRLQKLSSKAVPEQYPLLRTLQIAAEVAK